VFGKTFAASKIFTNERQGYNRKLIMASKVDITLFVSSFSIYVILLNLNVLLSFSCPKFKLILMAMQYVQIVVLALIVDLVEQPLSTTSHA
jgi:hypothetical protein